MKTITTPGAAAFKKRKLAKTAARRRENDDRRGLQEAITKDGVRNDLLPRCEITFRRVSDLKPAARKIRKLTTAQVERVIQSIRFHGFIGAIIIRKDRIVDGHTRHAAAEQLGLVEIPCIDVDHLSKEEARVLAIGLNRIAELGENDFDALKIEMGELLALDFDLTVTGFSGQEIDIITLDEPESIEAGEEEVPEPPSEPVSRRGDMFVMGEHRVACADALEPESYEMLLGPRVATALITDPPYNVKIQNNVSGLGKHKHDEFVMASGEMSQGEFHTFLKTSLKLGAERVIDGGAIMSFIDWRSVHTLMNAALEVGLRPLNLAVWDKGSGAMGSYLRSAHELIPIFSKGDSLAINNVQLGRHGRDRCNVWRYPGANRQGSSAAEALADHPSPKNVEMIEDAILDVTNRGDIVLDPFLGSGTTIIAAEKAGRIACGFELNPKYLDVIVSRWERMTGAEAIHEESSLTFAGLMELRRAEPSADQDREGRS
jgi:DNA modification methylase